MEEKVKNALDHCDVHQYVGGNQINNTINMFQDAEREFIVIHNVNIKPVSYFTGRELELKELRQKVEEGQKSVLVSGMGGIGKTHICRKLFYEYTKRSKKSPFHHIGYIEYEGTMDSSLTKCLKFKPQENPAQNQEAAWRELEYLSADGKLLLFVDNVNKWIIEDPSLERLCSISGAMILTSRLTSILDEFEPYPIGFLSIELCREIYEKNRYARSGRKGTEKELEDLNYVIEKLATRHTLTVEFLGKLAQVKAWSVAKLKEQLEEKGFCLEFKKMASY